MRLLKFFLVLLSVTACAMTRDDMRISNSKIRGAEAIDFCVTEYERLSGNRFPDEVDRAYVLSASDKLDVLFSDGEVGTFGDRSSTYKPILACGVLYAESMKLYFLSEPLKDPLVEVPGILQITESKYEETIFDSLFMRGKDGFNFHSSQEFKKREIPLPPSSTLD